MRRPASSYSLTFATLWGGIAATTFAVRWYKRSKSKRLEDQKSASTDAAFRNAVEALQWYALNRSDKVALVSCALVEYTWREYYRQVQQFGCALKSFADRGAVAIHSFNEERWFFSAVGALAAEWTVTGIYLTNSYPEAAHVLKTSEVRVLVLETAELLSTTYKTLFQDFPNITVVLLSGGDDDHASRTPSFDAFLKLASNISSDKLTPPAQLSPDTVASLVYTSGTTASPKAVQLTHKNITSVCAMMHARIPLDENTVLVSYLPLSHIAAMGIDIYSSLFCGAQVHFADSNALKGSLKDTLLRVRPTLFFGVPRVWEKMAAAMQEAAHKSYSKKGSGAVLKAIGSSAKSVGGAWWSADTSELVRCCFLVVPFGFFKLLAFRKVRRGCGLDRCKLLYTGAAPLSAATIQYLRSLDMPILEVFGMSESTGAIAVCGPQDGARPLGACGQALPNGDLMIAAEDGEILWSGNNVMTGYKGRPAATRSAVSDTGWLHTGDIGKIDNEGYLYITGRKKDLIITAGGENVAPTPIEQTLKTILGSHVGHVILIGDERKFLTVLIAPPEGKALPEGTLAAEVVEEAMKKYNDLHAKSRAQRVQKAHVLEHPFTVASGELTPTMKVKRRFVTTKFADEIDAMYSDDTAKLVGYSSMNIGKLESAIA